MSDPGIRAAQLADQIRDYIAPWLSRDLPGHFLTVTDVTLSSDLRKATVWVAAYTPESKRIFLNSKARLTKNYQQLLSRQLKRYTVPHIELRVDETAEASEHIQQLLK